MSFNPNLIFLIMGRSCNFRCSYCLQNKEHKVNDYTDISPEVLEYLKNYGGRVTFFGGEPFLYFSQVQKIVSETVGSGNSYAIMTNGSLIRQRHVEFLNRFDINLHVSWDGYKSGTTRSRNVMKENWGVIRQANKLWIPSVISAYNYPLEMLEAAEELDKDYFDLHGYHLSVFLNPVIKHCEGRMFDVDKDRLRREMAEIAANPNTALRQKVMQYAESVYRVGQTLGDEGYYYKCGYSAGLGLNGTIYECKNSCTPVGKLGEADDSVYREWMKKIDRNVNPTCTKCKVFPYCRGGCRILEGYRDDFCETQKTFFEPLVEWNLRNGVKSLVSSNDDKDGGC